MNEPPSSFGGERPGETLAPRKHPDSHPNSLGGGLYIDELFDEISGLAQSERELIIARRCAGHPSVEAEVRALLAVAAPTEPAPTLLLEPGAAVGRYRLEQRLGDGATASVWKAFDTHLHSFTALKMLHPDGRIRGSAALEAVLREARAASAIISDHVVRIKTAGRFEGGPHYVEMELCAEHRPGPQNTEILEIGRTLSEADLDSVEEVARVVAEAAWGVDAAHRVGVLHRDLKPGNILLTPVSRRAKVTDFGLAAEQLYRPPTAETPASATVTVQLEAGDGRIVGTPAYMPPEQAQGRPATRAGDVYALGATLYALLARKPPYEPSGSNPIQALDVLGQVRTGPPRPLSQIVRVPPRLAAIVDKAMARSQRERYQTAAELAQDLERWLADRTTTVDGRATLLELGLLELGLFVRRNQWLVGSVSVLCAALLLFALAIGWLNHVRGELQDDITLARVGLVEAQAATEAAEQIRIAMEKERDEAQTAAKVADEAAKVADEARIEALSGRTTAEADAKRELARRKEADAARLVAEQQLAAMEADRNLALISLDQAVADLEMARDAEARANTRADLEESEREVAEELVRAKERELAEAHQRLAEAHEALVSEQEARRKAEAKVRELQGQPPVPVPAPTPVPAQPEPEPEPAEPAPAEPAEPEPAEPQGPVFIPELDVPTP